MSASNETEQTSTAGLLLDREQELAILESLVAATAAGEGGAVLIEAPPGIGKSTLLDHAAAVARSLGVDVLRAAGRELEAGIGFGVARSMLEPWVFDLTPDERLSVLSGPAARARPLFDDEMAGPGSEFDLVHGLHWLIVTASQSAPTLVLVDDAQWADPPSLHLLVYVAGRLHGRPLGLLVATRPGDDPSGLLDQLATEPHVTVVAPAPLGPAATTTLVRALLPAAEPEVCARCHELTGGNPFQLHTLIAAMRDSSPDGGSAGLELSASRAARSLARSIQRRLRARSIEANRLAAAVAVAEGGLTLRTAGALAALSSLEAIRAADELIAADLFRPGERLEFAHPLVRRAVHDLLPNAERVEWHARIAARLIEDGAPDERVAAHLLHTPPNGDPTTVEVLRRAAARATAAGGATSAIRYLRRALDDADDDRRGEVLAELGRAEWIAGRRDAIGHLEAAIDASPDGVSAARRRLDLGRALHDFADLPRACAVLDSAARDLPDDPALSELALDLEAAYLTSSVGVPDLTEAAHRRADEIFADETLHETRAGRALASKALSMRTYQNGTREQLLGLARALLDRGELASEIATQAISHVIIAFSFCDDYRAAEEALNRAREEVERGGWHTFRAAVATLTARQTIWTGPIGEAISVAREAVETFVEARQLYLPSALSVLVRGLLEADRLVDAEAAVGLLAGQPEPQGLFAAWGHESVARVAARRGDHDAAVRAGLLWGRRATEGRILNPAIFHWRSHTGLAALHLGDRSLAERLIGEELVLAEGYGSPRALAVARRAAATLERGQTAIDLLASAVELCAGCGARVEHAESLVALGAATRRAGRPKEARRILRDAVERADTVNAERVAREARAELVLAGGRSPVTRKPTELTGSERRVAELAASGLTNRQIAGQLYVSVKNVEWHLANAYRRLGIARRTELASALSRLDGKD